MPCQGVASNHQKKLILKVQNAQLVASYPGFPSSFPSLAVREKRKAGREGWERGYTTSAFICMQG